MVYPSRWYAKLGHFVDSEPCLLTERGVGWINGYAATFRGSQEGLRHSWNMWGQVFWLRTPLAEWSGLLVMNLCRLVTWRWRDQTLRWRRLRWRGYDWASYFIRQSETIAMGGNTSNDSVIVVITVGASTLESMGGLYKCLMMRKKKLTQWFLTFQCVKKSLLDQLIYHDVVVWGQCVVCLR